jgi:hypothetical protein
MSWFNQILFSFKERGNWNSISDDVRSYILDKEFVNLRKLGLFPEKPIEVPVENLIVQYRTEWPMREPQVIQENLPLWLCKSFLTELLDDYVESKLDPETYIKDLSRLKNSHYYQIWQRINAVGWRYDWYFYPNKIAKHYDDASVFKKIYRLILTYENIKKIGYGSNEFKVRMITVLEKPFENSRFGFQHPCPKNSFEIWSGHHRAASLHKLGIPKAKVILLKDLRPKKGT